MNLSLLASFLDSDASPAARTAAVKTALESPAGRKLRDELGNWVIRLLPAEAIVPEIYAAWRPLVRDAMLFMISHLSAARLAPKLVEQIELPLDTTPEARLLRLIAKVPGLQKIGQVLARNRHLDSSLRNALSELENGIRDVSAEEIGALVRKRLGRRLENYAVEIEPGILAEASVSAVVRFTWRNPASGERERGVFKVLKPFVSACFAEDLELLQRLAHFLADKHPEYGRALPETIMEVRRLLEHEVDFAREQATLAEAARVYKGVRGVRVPRLIKSLSTGAITALSEEAGVKVTALAGASGRERRRVAELLIEALIAVPLSARGERSIFHADPHAGNLLYDERTGELVLLDWALTESLTRDDRRHVAMLAAARGHAGADAGLARPGGGLRRNRGAGPGAAQPGASPLHARPGQRLHRPVAVLAPAGQHGCHVPVGPAGAGGHPLPIRIDDVPQDAVHPGRHFARHRRAWPADGPGTGAPPAGPFPAVAHRLDRRGSQRAAVRRPAVGAVGTSGLEPGRRLV
ncbi:MAG: AarF/UbiB family protein [Bryobacteraceae bacterium]